MNTDEHGWKERGDRSTPGFGRPRNAVKKDFLQKLTKETKLLGGAFSHVPPFCCGCAALRPSVVSSLLFMRRTVN
jgi:hypothetical protein